MAMKLAQLKSLVKRGESEILEFKETTGSLKAGMKTVCAFLNSNHGGTVLFGVMNHGSIVGQEISDTTLKAISEEFYKIDPQLNIVPQRIKVKDKLYVLALLVNPSSRAPYAYDGRSYVRSQSTTRSMSKEEFIYLHNKNNQTAWEGLTNNSCTIKDLDVARIKTVIRMAVSENRISATALTASTPDILKRLNLMVDNKLTNAAVILFCKKENKQFMQSTLKIARFRGLDKTEFIDNQPPYTANAFELYDIAMKYLKFYLPTAAKIVSGRPERVETPAIPYAVLREAIINALIHRDYCNPGTSLYIARYDDRVEISNVGGLSSELSVSKLASSHASIKRNPLIANVFFMCGMIENWGRGTINMIEECKRAKVPIPIFKSDGKTFDIIIPLKEPTPTIIYEKAEPLPTSTQATLTASDFAKASTDTTPGAGAKLTDRQQSILNVLKSGPLSRQQIMTKLKTKLAERTMRQELTALKKMGLIVATGKTKSVIWMLKLIRQ